MNFDRTTKMPESIHPRTAALAKRLTILYMAALGAIALLTMIGQLVVQQAIIQLEGDSRIVNIAGRQRMFSQRLTRLTLEMAYTREHSPASVSLPSDPATNIRTDLDSWTQNHDGLQHGSEILKLPGKNSRSVDRLFDQIAPHFEALGRIIESTLMHFSPGGDQRIDADTRSELSFQSDAFLAGMDDIVTRLEQEARDRVNRLRWIETALLFATIAVLVCEGLFVFSPAATSLTRSLTKLHQTSYELENAKEAAEKANSAKTDFLRRVSHELRTPLHAILGMLGLVEQSKLSHGQRNKIRLANEASTSLLSLVNDLLDVASIELGREIILHPELVDLHGLVRSTAEVMRPMAVQKGLQFHLSLDDSLPNLVTVDADKVRQILTNLLQNAIRYTARGQVCCNASIKAEATKVSLVFSVEDTGIGISQDDQVQIFASFSRGNIHVESDAFGRGMGLGLAITQAMVKNLSGTLSLKSEVGKGSRFTVILPIEIAKDAPSEPKPNSTGTSICHRNPRQVDLLRPLALNPNGAMPTALIVDDSTANLLVMRSYLRQLGYRTMSVSSLQQSLLKFRKHRFDVIFMDRHLSDGDGLNFPNMLSGPMEKSLFASTKVLLVTAEIHLKSDNDERLKPFFGVLHKPISLSQLRAAIDGAVPCGHVKVAEQTETGDPDSERLRRKLARNLISVLPREIESFKKMVTLCDYAGIEFASHRLIGSAGNAGLTDIASLAFSLHEAAGNKDTATIECNLSKLSRFLVYPRSGSVELLS